MLETLHLQPQPLLLPAAPLLLPPALLRPPLPAEAEPKPSFLPVHGLESPDDGGEGFAPAPSSVSVTSVLVEAALQRLKTREGRQRQSQQLSSLGSQQRLLLSSLQQQTSPGARARTGPGSGLDEVQQSRRRVGAFVCGGGGGGDGQRAEEEQEQEVQL